VVGGIEWVTADGTIICRHVLYCGSTNKREKMSPLKSIFLEYYRCVWLGVVILVLLGAGLKVSWFPWSHVKGLVT
jgi:hypothetical protein